MGLHYDYKFKNPKNKQKWQDILNNTFEHMKKHYKNKLHKQGIFSNFKKAFKITPIALKTSKDNDIYKFNKAN